MKRHLFVQPLAFKTPDVNSQGFIDLPEFPFGKYLVFTVNLGIIHHCNVLTAICLALHSKPLGTFEPSGKQPLDYRTSKCNHFQSWGKQGFR